MRPNTTEGVVYACSDLMRQILRLVAAHQTEDSAFRTEVASSQEPVSMTSTFAEPAELLRESENLEPLFGIARAGCGLVAEHSAGDAAATGRLQSRRNDLRDQIRWFEKDN